MMAQGPSTKRPFQPIMEEDTIYGENPHPIRGLDTSFQHRLYQSMSDCDTVCPPKKRALFDYNREQARVTSSAENSRTHFQLDKKHDEFSEYQGNRNRQAFFSNKLKLDRHEHESEIRPRSDSLHSINSQYSEMSSIDSSNTSSRESSPVMGENDNKLEAQLRNSVSCVNDSVMHNQINSKQTEKDATEKKGIAKDHETPERNPMVVMNGIKSDIQKPLFTSGSPELGAANKSKSVISKTLFPLNQTDLLNLEQNMSQSKLYSSQNYIPFENEESFRNSDSELKNSFKPNFDIGKQSSKENKPKSFGSMTGKNTQPINDENKRPTESPKRLSGKILGDVTNSLNVIGKKIDSTENSTVLGVITNRINVEMKLMEQHKNPQEIFTCPLCSKQFGQYETFNNHMKIHEKNSKVRKCDICGAEFDNGNLLRSHMQAAHTGAGCQSYKCEKCNREFSQFNNLRRHMRVHREKTYKCHLCDRVFNEEFYLKMHVGTHTGQRVYSCGVCNAPFQSNQELKAHVKTHSPSQLHNCNICGKSFSKACVLRQHKKTHSGERPHHCAACGKTFIHRHHLTMHMRSHAASKPYTCELCSKEFSQTSHLYKHLRQHEEEHLENTTNEPRDESDGVNDVSSGISNDLNKEQKRRIGSHENNISNTKMGVRKSKKENLENMDPSNGKDRTQRKKSESKVLKNYKSVTDRQYSKAILQERNANTQEINLNTGSYMNYHTGGANMDKNKSNFVTRRPKEFALNVMESTRPKKGNAQQQIVQKSTSQLTQVPNENYTAVPLSENAFGTSFSSVASASTRLPSFNSITSSLKESQTNQSTTNTPKSVPYYQPQSFEQTLYPYGYPSMGYGSSSMYLAYSAQVQAYYNMLYYNSKALNHNQYTSLGNNQYQSTEKGKAWGNNQYLSTENVNPNPYTSVISEGTSKGAETLKLDLHKYKEYSENSKSSWYRIPEGTSTIYKRESNNFEEYVNTLDKHKKNTEASEKIVKSSNTLLIAALKEGDSAEADKSSETHTNEHILKLMNLKDRFLEENADHAVNGQMTEFKAGNERGSVITEAVDTSARAGVEIPATQVNMTDIANESNRTEIDNQINKEQLELSGNKEMETCMNQRIQIANHDKNDAENSSLANVNEYMNKDNEMAERTSVGSESYSQENDGTNNDGNKEADLSSNLICCDTCSFTFSGKDDLKKHFLENPACFSKVCETSKISEEFGWQLLDYYLASLEMYKSNKGDVDISSETERNTDLGDISVGTIQENAESLVEQSNENKNSLEEGVCTDSSLALELQKTEDPEGSKSDSTQENDNSELVINVNQRQKVINSEQNQTAENISQVLSDDERFKEKRNKHFVDHLPDSEVASYSQEGTSDNMDYKCQNKEISNQQLDEAILIPSLNEINIKPAVDERNGSGIWNGTEDNTKQQSQINKKNTSKFICPFCETEFKDNDTLESHIQTHPPDRPFTCTHCSRTFTHKHHLKRHMMSHSDKSIECQVCKRSFKEKFYLEMHMKVHLLPDYKQCEICGESFAKIDIVDHVKGHMGPIKGNPTYEQIGERVKEIMKENAEIVNEKVKSEVLDLSNKQVSKENLMKMSVEQLKSFMVSGKKNIVE